MSYNLNFGCLKATGGGEPRGVGECQGAAGQKLGSPCPVGGEDWEHCMVMQYLAVLLTLLWQDEY